MLKKIFILLVTCYLSLVTATHAQEPKGQDFASSYDVLYDVSDDGVTTVTQKISLRNLTSQYYASQFKLTIGTTQISDIKASDDSGKLDIQSAQKDTSTEISVKFNQQVVGVGKQLNWTLNYKSKDFAQHPGKIWEITLPKALSKGQLDDYKVTLSVPLSFGEPTLITPNPKAQTTNSGKMFLTFEKKDLLQDGISATFGENQLYDFNLTYHLQNTSLIPVLTSIALPPDTNYQDIIFQRITPNPINVTVDDDGNYLAWFRVGRGEKFDVSVLGSAKLYTKSKISNPYLANSLKQKYLEPKKYWESDNSALKSKLSEILKDIPNNASNAEKAKLIYQFVVNFLNYDPSRLSSNTIERLGAVSALNNPTSAVCMEFTDLFIALSRAAGIPTRELDGFAYTSNNTLRPLSLRSDVLHAWPEYWDDSKGWVMIDPTWGNTTSGVDYFNKLDLNHFVFVVKGISSEQPIPAGSYKYRNEDSHDVKVTLSDVDFLGKPQLNVNFKIGDVWAGLPGQTKIVIQNQGNAAIFPINFSILSEKLTLFDKDLKLGTIPAFGSYELNLSYRTKSFLDSFSDNLILTINNQKFIKSVTIKPFFIFNNTPIFLISLAFFMILIYSGILGGLIYRKKRKSKIEIKKSK